MSKDYVTIKIPRKTRDQARDDPRTYEAIMQAGLGKEPSSISTVQTAIDYDRLREIVTEELSNVTITANIDMAGYDGNMTEADVRAWIEAEIQEHVAEQVRNV